MAHTSTFAARRPATTYMARWPTTREGGGLYLGWRWSRATWSRDHLRLRLDVGKMAWTTTGQDVRVQGRHGRRPLLLPSSSPFLFSPPLFSFSSPSPPPLLPSSSLLPAPLLLPLSSLLSSSSSAALQSRAGARGADRGAWPGGGGGGPPGSMAGGRGRWATGERGRGAAAVPHSRARRIYLEDLFALILTLCPSRSVIFGLLSKLLTP